jgi:hypothetical protein
MRIRQFKITRDVGVWKHATMHELADAANTPADIHDGTGWGTYFAQLRGAQQWVNDIAEREGHADRTLHTPGWRRTIELSDEVNRHGAGGKSWAMAEQYLRATPAGSGFVPRSEYRRVILGDIEREILKHWTNYLEYGSMADQLDRLMEERRNLHPTWFEGGPAHQTPSWEQMTGGKEGPLVTHGLRGDGS